MEISWSTIVIIQDRDCHFWETLKIEKVAVDDDVSLMFSCYWPVVAIYWPCSAQP